MSPLYNLLGPKDLLENLGPRSYRIYLPMVTPYKINQERVDLYFLENVLKLLVQSTAQVHGNTGLSNQVHDFLVQSKVYIPSIIKTQMNIIPICFWADLAVRAVLKLSVFAKESYFWEWFCHIFMGKKETFRFLYIVASALKVRNFDIFFFKVCILFGSK